MQARRLGGLCYLWVLVSRPRENRDQRTGHSAHTASLHQYSARGNQPRYPLTQKGGARLDDTACPMAF